MNIQSLSRYVMHGLKFTHTLGLDGNHGIGKTSFVKYTMRDLIAKKHGLPIDRVHVITRCVSIMDPADLIGNFIEFNGRTYNCPPNWIPTAKCYDDMMEELFESNGRKYTRLTNYDDIYILFLDERKRGNPMVQDGIMELLLEHTLFGAPLHEKTYVVCADNDNIEIYHGTKTDPAQESRIKSTKFSPTNSEFLADWNRRVEEGTMHSIVPEFLDAHKECISLPTNTIRDMYIAGKKPPCPRDWTTLGEALKDFALEGDDIVNGSASYLTDVAAMHVGQTYATKFAAYCLKERQFKVTPEDIVETFEDVRDSVEKAFAKDPTSAVGVVRALVPYITDITLDDEQAHNVAAFLQVCPGEAVSALYSEWNKLNKHQFAEWQNTPLRYNVFNRAIMNNVAKEPGKQSAYEKWCTAFCKRYDLNVDDLSRDDIRVQ
ncbi:MAG: hypothetical protein MJZ25_08950 [Fibrobacter sp.]|nr:hypothetical protein [Fibrobacter sp.]